MTVEKMDIVVSVVARRETITAASLIGFDNTGNVCVWPSEEVLAFFCIQNKNLFRDRIVVELGAGMTGLAGICVARTCEPRAVLLTDGNNNSFAALRENVETNIPCAYQATLQEVQALSEVTQKYINTEPHTCANKVACERLVWEMTSPVVESMSGKVDVIVCADCLFFRECHTKLAAVISTLLRSNSKNYHSESQANKSKAIFIQPRRGNTLQSFLDVIEKNHPELIATLVERYDETVWNAHTHFRLTPEYNPDLHYPMLLVLTKK
eukprot:CFRG5732T1